MDEIVISCVESPTAEKLPKFVVVPEVNLTIGVFASSIVNAVNVLPGQLNVSTPLASVIFTVGIVIPEPLVFAIDTDPELALILKVEPVPTNVMVSFLSQLICDAAPVLKFIVELVQSNVLTLVPEFDEILLTSS